LASLPDPDRAFVGGGGTPVLRSVLARLRPDGRAVATYADLERAAQGCRLLGRMVQVAVSRAAPLADGGLRLQAANPVFVAWGPDGDHGD
jgi:precorrin-6Y C5,15-methyltransferase (decarboxylating)